MAVTHLEINVRRLLKKCEQLAKQNDSDDEWRLQKYVESLEQLLNELYSSDRKPSKDDSDRYRRRIEYLKGVIQARKMVSPVQKMIATQMLPSVDDSESEEIKDIQQQLVVQCEQELREQLFGNSITEESVIRRRDVYFGEDSRMDVEAEIDTYRLKQEKISEDMLIITRNMKEQSELAGRIIRQDTKLLESSKDVLDKNQTHLQKQSNRLDDFIRKSTWNCWIWLMVAVIVAVFISMVMFMKVSKKRFSV